MVLKHNTKVQWSKLIQSSTSDQSSLEPCHNIINMRVGSVFRMQTTRITQGQCSIIFKHHVWTLLYNGLVITRHVLYLKVLPVAGLSERRRALENNPDITEFTTVWIFIEQDV